MREMTITQALVELKTLDSRIDKAVNKEFVGVAKNCEKDTDLWKDFERRAKSNLQSAVDLINERSKIKSAIVKSNAETLVQVGDVEMTVAEAIERKGSIEYEKALLHSIQRQFSQCTLSITQQNAEVDRKLDSLLATRAGSDSKDSAEDIGPLSEAYFARHGFCLADPVGAQNIIDHLEERITQFETNVDVALSVSNARTTITLE